MDIIQRIQSKQTASQPPLDFDPPPHRPEMLYIGCIDARLDPIDDIGIPKGKALIYRNVAALVRPAQDRQATCADTEVMAVAGEIPESTSMGAALEFFIHHLPAPPEGRSKHIVVSGHTDCGGIRACLHGAGAQDRFLPKYLRALEAARNDVLADASLTGDEERLYALEKASVRASLANLRTYAAVSAALREGRVALHGWVINTATQRIEELDARTGEFRPMALLTR